MHQIAAPRLHLHRHDLSRHLCRKRHCTLSASRGEFGHEQPTARDRPRDRPPQPARAGSRRGRAHLHIGGHPRQFARRGDNYVAGLQPNLEHRHGGSGDAGLHGGVPPRLGLLHCGPE
jgi:hypothetical protein